MSWNLPTAVSVGGVEYAINTDYRDVLDIISRLNDMTVAERERAYVCLALFYDDFRAIPPRCYTDAVREMHTFINCGVEESDDRPRPILLDWEQDQNIIVADVNRVAGCEIRALPYLHWWSFVAFFNGIGEGQLSTIVSIRDKKRRGKPLERWERDYYRDNKSRVDLRTRYTAEELAEREQLNKLLG